jgi:hypothetical protein
MRQVKVHLAGWMIAGAMAELQIWLDQYRCVPRLFEITTALFTNVNRSILPARNRSAMTG